MMMMMMMMMMIIMIINILSGEMFRVTTFPLENIKEIPVTDKGDTDFTKDFFGKPTYLTVSGQLSGATYNVNVLLLIDDDNDDNDDDAVVVCWAKLLVIMMSIAVIIFKYCSFSNIHHRYPYDRQYHHHHHNEHPIIIIIRRDLCMCTW